MEIQETVKSYADLYKTIDLRVIAFLKEGAWNASHVVIRLRLETVGDVQTQQNRIIERFQQISTDTFKIIFSSIPFDQFNTLKQNWIDGKIVIEDQTIKIKPEHIFRHGFDAPRSSDNTDYVNTEWHSYSVHQSINLQDVSLLFRDMSHNAISVGCGNMDDYISKILETSTYQINNGFYILSVPIFFKIENMFFDENHLEIKCIGTNERLGGSLTIYETDPHNHMRGRAKLQKSFVDFDIENTGTWEFTVKSNLSSVDPNDEFEIIFIRNNVIIEKKSGAIRWHWPNLSRVVNPAYGIFSKFIPDDELKNALLEPQPKRISNVGTFGPDKIFERSVTWLLNLLSISSINLQEYDQTGEGVNRISLDIVGKFDNTIILCHPTIATNLEGVIDTAKNVKDIIKREFNGGLKIKSIVFTPKSVQTQRNSITDEDVILLGKEELEFILNELNAGNLEQARRLVLGTTDSV